jgi:hypothetical protein
VDLGPERLEHRVMALTLQYLVWAVPGKLDGQANDDASARDSKLAEGSVYVMWVLLWEHYSTSANYSLESLVVLSSTKPHVIQNHLKNHV